MLYAAEALSSGHNCRILGFGKDESDIFDTTYDCAVLPVQKSPDGKTIPSPFSEKASPIEYSILGKLLKAGGTVFTGNVCTELEKVCYGYGLALINYLEREELAVANAVPTAEGALKLAIEKMPVTLFGSKMLITGFGRIAKILAKYLNALGADVTVACRKKSDMKWAEIFGCKTVDITRKSDFRKALANIDVIFNTVPAEVMTEKDFQKTKKQILYIELASKNGLNPEAADKLGLSFTAASGLPGKTAPVTAGRIIAETIGNILKERSDFVES